MVEKQALESIEIMTMDYFTGLYRVAALYKGDGEKMPYEEFRTFVVEMWRGELRESMFSRMKDSEKLALAYKALPPVTSADQTIFALRTLTKSLFEIIANNETPRKKTMSLSFETVTGYFAPFYVLSQAFYSKETVELQLLKSFVRDFYKVSTQEGLMSLVNSDESIKLASESISNYATPRLTELLSGSLNEMSYEVIVQNAQARLFGFRPGVQW